MKRASLLLAVPLLVFAACGDDADDAADAPAGADGGDVSGRDLDGVDDGTGDTTAPDQPAGDAEQGFVVVHMEPTDAIFIEGFDVGVRLEDPDTGEVFKEGRWSELFAPDADLYTAFLEHPVRPGPVRVGIDVNIGIGPGPEPPDLDADRMPCELEAEVVAGETIEVEVSFDDSTPDCARVVE